MKLLKVKAVAELLNVSQACVYALAEQGRLPGFRIGVGRGTWRFDEADVLKYLLDSKQPSRPRTAPRPATRGQPFRHLDGDRLRAAWKQRGVDVE